jgi:hypothetical protein
VIDLRPDDPKTYRWGKRETKSGRKALITLETAKSKISRS